MHFICSCHLIIVPRGEFVVLLSSLNFYFTADNNQDMMFALFGGGVILLFGQRAAPPFGLFSFERRESFGVSIKMGMGCGRPITININLPWRDCCYYYLGGGGG